MALGAGNVQINVGATGLTQSIVNQVQAAQRQIPNLNVQLNTKGFRQPLGRITGDLSEFQNSLDASVARTLAFGAAVGVINSLSNAFRGMIGSAIEVEKKLADVNVILNLNSKALGQFSSQLFEIAKNTGQSFNEVSDAAVELSRQGLGAEETLKRISDAMILTRLSGMAATKSVETLTAAVNGFGSAALTTTDIINKLATVDAAFAVSTDDLSNALARAGSTAQAAKVSMDELLGAVTSVQQTTARGGAVIGNAFKSIFTRIQRSAVREQLEAIGVATTDAAGNIRNAMAILEDYAQVYKTLSDGQKAYTDELLAGVFQINNLRALVKDLGSDFSIYERAVDQAANATDEATRRNEQLNKTLSALVIESVASLKELAATLGNVLAGPAVKNILDIFNSISNAFTKAFDPEKGSTLIKGMFSAIGSWIAGPGLIIVGAAFIKLFKFITVQSLKAVGEVFKIGAAADKVKTTEAQITAILKNNSQLYNQISNQALTHAQREQLVLDEINKENAALRQQEAIIARLARSRSVGGALRSAAGGFIPSFANNLQGAIASERQAIMAGEGGASSGAQPKVLRGFPTGGGRRETLVANTDEVIVPKFGGSSGSAILNKNMIKSIGGVPEGAIPVARGFIPNFQRGKKQTKGASGKGIDPQQENIATALRYAQLSGVNAAFDASAYGVLFGVGESGAASPKKGGLNFVLGNSAGARNVLEPMFKNTITSNPKTILGDYLQLGTHENYRRDHPRGIKLAPSRNTQIQVDNTKTAAVVPSADDNYASAEAEFTNRIIKPAAESAVKKIAQVVFTSLLTDQAIGKKMEQSKVAGNIAKGAEGELFEVAMDWGSQVIGSQGPGKFEVAGDTATWDFGGESAQRISGVWNSLTGANQIDAKRRYKPKHTWFQARSSIASKIFQDPAASKMLGNELAAAAKTKSTTFLEQYKKLQGKGKTPRTAASGFIPNFADALEEAIVREKAALGAQGSGAGVYIDQDNRLKGSKNPLGLMVANTRDEPLAGSQGVNRAISGGMNPKTMGAAQGFVPSFIAGAGIVSTFGRGGAGGVGGAATQTTGSFKKLTESLKNSTAASFGLSIGLTGLISGLESVTGTSFGATKTVTGVLPLVTGVISKFGVYGKVAAGAITLGALAWDLFTANNKKAIKELEKEIKTREEELKVITQNIEKTDKFIDHVAKLNSALDAGNVDAAGKSLTAMFETAEKMGGIDPDAMDRLVASLGDTEKFKKASQDLQDSVKAGVAVEEFSVDIAKATKTILEESDNIKDVDFSGLARKLASTVKGEELKRAAGRLAGVEITADNAADTLQSLKTVFGQLDQQTQDNILSNKNFAKAFAENLKAQLRYKNAVQILTERLDALNKPLVSLGPNIKKLGQALTNLAEDSKTALDILQETEKIRTDTALKELQAFRTVSAGTLAEGRAAAKIENIIKKSSRDQENILQAFAAKVVEEAATKEEGVVTSLEDNATARVLIEELRSGNISNQSALEALSEAQKDEAKDTIEALHSIRKEEAKQIAIAQEQLKAARKASTIQTAANLRNSRISQDSLDALYALGGGTGAFERSAAGREQAKSLDIMTKVVKTLETFGAAGEASRLSQMKEQNANTRQLINLSDSIRALSGGKLEVDASSLRSVVVDLEEFERGRPEEFGELDVQAQESLRQILDSTRALVKEQERLGVGVAAAVQVEEAETFNISDRSISLLAEKISDPISASVAALLGLDTETLKTLRSTDKNTDELSEEIINQEQKNRKIEEDNEEAKRKIFAEMAKANRDLAESVGRLGGEASHLAKAAEHLENAAKALEERGAAAGFVPNFAPSPVSRALQTESRFGAKEPVVDHHPSVGAYVRDNATQKSFSGVRRDHPEGIRKAVKNSAKMQGVAGRGFVPNFIMGDPMIRANIDSAPSNPEPGDAPAEGSDLSPMIPTGDAFENEAQTRWRKWTGGGSRRGSRRLRGGAADRQYYNRLFEYYTKRGSGAEVQGELNRLFQGRAQNMAIDSIGSPIRGFDLPGLLGSQIERAKYTLTAPDGSLTQFSEWLEKRGWNVTGSPITLGRYLQDSYATNTSASSYVRDVGPGDIFPKSPEGIEEFLNRDPGGRAGMSLGTARKRAGGGTRPWYDEVAETGEVAMDLWASSIRDPKIKQPPQKVQAGSRTVRAALHEKFQREAQESNFTFARLNDFDNLWKFTTWLQSTAARSLRELRPDLLRDAAYMRALHSKGEGITGDTPFLFPASIATGEMDEMSTLLKDAAFLTTEKLEAKATKLGQGGSSGEFSLKKTPTLYSKNFLEKQIATMNAQEYQLLLLRQQFSGSSKVYGPDQTFSGLGPDGIPRGQSEARRKQIFWELTSPEGAILENVQAGLVRARGYLNSWKTLALRWGPDGSRYGFLHAGQSNPADSAVMFGLKDQGFGTEAYNPQLAEYLPHYEQNIKNLFPESEHGRAKIGATEAMEENNKWKVPAGKTADRYAAAWDWLVGGSFGGGFAEFDIGNEPIYSPDVRKPLREVFGEGVVSRETGLTGGTAGTKNVITALEQAVFDAKRVAAKRAGPFDPKVLARSRRVRPKIRRDDLVIPEEDDLEKVHPELLGTELLDIKEDKPAEIKTLEELLAAEKRDSQPLIDQLGPLIEPMEREIKTKGTEQRDLRYAALMGSIEDHTEFETDGETLNREEVRKRLNAVAGLAQPGENSYQRVLSQRISQNISRKLDVERRLAIQPSATDSRRLAHINKVHEVLKAQEDIVGKDLMSAMNFLYFHKRTTGPTPLVVDGTPPQLIHGLYTGTAKGKDPQNIQDLALSWGLRFDGQDWLDDHELSKENKYSKTLAALGGDETFLNWQGFYAQSPTDQRQQRLIATARQFAPSQDGRAFRRIFGRSDHKARQKILEDMGLRLPQSAVNDGDADGLFPRSPESKGSAMNRWREIWESTNNRGLQYYAETMLRAGKKDDEDSRSILSGWHFEPGTQTSISRIFDDRGAFRELGLGDLEVERVMSQLLSMTGGNQTVSAPYLPQADIENLREYIIRTQIDTFRENEEDRIKNKRGRTASSRLGPLLDKDVTDTLMKYPPYLYSETYSRAQKGKPVKELIKDVLTTGEIENWDEWQAYTTGLASNAKRAGWTLGSNDAPFKGIRYGQPLPFPLGEYTNEQIGGKEDEFEDILGKSIRWGQAFPYFFGKGPLKMAKNIPLMRLQANAGINPLEVILGRELRGTLNARKRFAEDVSAAAAEIGKSLPGARATTTTWALAGIPDSTSLEDWATSDSPPRTFTTAEANKFWKTFRESTGEDVAARGFVPNFAAVTNEIAASRAAGYRKPVTGSQVKSMNIPGAGKTTYNSQESVFKARGMTQPFIRPPADSRAAKGYAGAVSKKFGFNPYKDVAAQGFIPNLAPVDRLGGLEEAGQLFTQATETFAKQNREFGDAANMIKQSSEKLVDASNATASLDLSAFSSAAETVQQGLAGLGNILKRGVELNSAPIIESLNALRTTLTQSISIEMQLVIPAIDVNVGGAGEITSQIQSFLTGALSNLITSNLREREPEIIRMVGEKYGL